MSAPITNSRSHSPDVESTVALTQRILISLRNDDLPHDVEDVLSSAYARLRRLDSDLKFIADSERVHTIEFARKIAGDSPP